jgi:hypothetical protein
MWNDLNDRTETESVELQKLESLEERYGVDTREMGKLLVVVSVTAFLLSVNMIYGLGELESTVSDANNNLSRAAGIVETDSFQSSVESLENDRRAGISRDAQLVAGSLQEASKALNQMEEAENSVETHLETYRYVVLMSVAGTVAGMSLMVM